MGTLRIITPQTKRAAMATRRQVAIEALIEQITANPSGTFIVTVHQGVVTQVAAVARPINIEELTTPEEPEEKKPRRRRKPKTDQAADADQAPEEAAE